MKYKIEFSIENNSKVKNKRALCKEKKMIIYQAVTNDNSSLLMF